MYTLEKLLEQIPEIEEKIGYHFCKPELLVQAFIHRSYVNEHRDLVDTHNERLEFLGDCVLGLIVSDYLYHHLPQHSEGDLSHMRSQLVEAGICGVYVQRLKLDQYILLSRGEQMSDGRGRTSIIADLFEAILAVIYLDGGLEEARNFFLRSFQPDLEAVLRQPLQNWKAQFQDWAQRKFQRPPIYRVVDESGPDHSKIFRVIALVGEIQMGEGRGASKKQAEQAAAADAMQKVECAHG